MTTTVPRPARTWLLWGVPALLLAGLGGAYAWYHFSRAAPPTIEERGGVVLQYELDPEDKCEPGVMKLLVDVLQGRFAMDDMRHIVVRAVNEQALEILIPDAGQLAADVERAKALAARVGHLEFRILANSVDDAKGMGAAKATLASWRGDKPDELAEFGDKGLPPPAPMKDDLKTKELFNVNLAMNLKSTVSYGWVELGPQECRLLNLDNAAAEDPERQATWIEIQGKLHEATKLKEIGTPGRWLRQGALFFGRPCTNRKLSAEERATKRFDYFVLARDPEIDGATGAPTSKIDGSLLTHAAPTAGEGATRVVSFNFSTQGAALFGELTKKNVPSGSGAEDSKVRRHLAIILDGLVVSAPTINSEIRNAGQINGNFTPIEAANLAAILRAGALPCRLKLQPTSEKTVPPQKK